MTLYSNPLFTTTTLLLKTSTKYFKDAELSPILKASPFDGVLPRYESGEGLRFRRVRGDFIHQLAPPSPPPSPDLLTSTLLADVNGDGDDSSTIFF